MYEAGIMKAASDKNKTVIYTYDDDNVYLPTFAIDTSQYK